MSEVAAEDLLWDLDSFHGSRETSFGELLEDIERDINRFMEPKQTHIGAIGEVILQYESILIRIRHLEDYLLCRRMGDVFDNHAPVLTVQLSEQKSRFAVASDGLLRALAELAPEEIEALHRDERLVGAGKLTDELCERGRQLLSPEEEVFITRSQMAGWDAWGRLASDCLAKGRLACTRADGTRRTMPVAQRHAALASGDPVLRESSYRGVQDFARANVALFAAAINGRTGSHQALCDRRKTDPRAKVAAANQISRRTLTVMMEVVRSRSARVAAYAPLKARLMGLKGLSLHDRTAALSIDATQCSYPNAIEMIERAFARRSTSMADAVRSIRKNRWLDALPRESKGMTGLCVWSPVTGQQRVLAAFDGSFASATILAHELGHGFHGAALINARPSLRDAPSTIAETIAILGEHLLRDYLAEESPRDAWAPLAAVAGELDAALNYLVRIPRDFAVEEEIHRLRRLGELTETQLRQISKDSFRQWFGGNMTAIADDELSWVTNNFYYWDDFFNWQYTFAYLLSSHVVELMSAEDANGKLLERLIDCCAVQDVNAGVQVALGINLESADFWDGAYTRFERYLERFRAQLAGGQDPA